MSRRRRKKKNRYVWKVILCLTLALIIAIAGMMICSISAYKKESEMIPYSGEEYEYHNYDWSNLEWNGSLLSYEDENYTSLQGIDVSAHQQEIDWEQVRNAGIDFAFIRVGYRGYEYGFVNDDDYFEENMEGAAENGIAIGVYFFSQATSVVEAGEEAEYVISRLKDYDIQLPVVFDMEEAGADGSSGRAANLDRIQKTQMAVTFLNCIRDAGYTPMIYNSSKLFEKYFDLDYLQDYEFWVADYDDHPKYDYHFTVWQYTSSGYIDGVDTRCDMDLMLVPKNE